MLFQHILVKAYTLNTIRHICVTSALWENTNKKNYSKANFLIFVKTNTHRQAGLPQRTKVSRAKGVLSSTMIILV